MVLEEAITYDSVIVLSLLLTKKVYEKIQNDGSCSREGPTQDYLQIN